MTNLSRPASAPIFGVCAGLARASQIPAWIIRLAFLLVPGGFVAYVVCAVLMPIDGRS